MYRFNYPVSPISASASSHGISRASPYIGLLSKMNSKDDDGMYNSVFSFEYFILTGTQHFLTSFTNIKAYNEIQFVIFLLSYYYTIRSKLIFSKDNKVDSL